MKWWENFKSPWFWFKVWNAWKRRIAGEKPKPPPKKQNFNR